MKTIVLLCLLITTTLCAEVVEDRCGLTIATPALKERATRKLRLENGLEALLISDPGAVQSGAALAVGVGSFQDPKERPGMAHFVEHLLFLGTEKYPEEEGYSRYLDEHGGQHNAFTMSDRTLYMFSVNNKGFDEALDRFGWFFIAPCFNPSGVARESHAIHQEYCKYIPSDQWRMLYVKKELANQDHPFHCFCIGNLETLAKISQTELKEWVKSHYSASLMHLVVYSCLPLDELEQKVEALFSQVPKRPLQLTPCHIPLFTEEALAKMVKIAPVQEVQMLELVWEIPQADEQTQCDKLVSYVLGHEGETSLLAQLKRESLATHLSTGSFRTGQGQALFTLSIALTDKGVKAYETVIARAFEAIAALRHSGVPRFIFDEMQKIESLNYTYQSREEVFQLVMEYATNMVDESLETFPRSFVMPTRYDTEQITALLERLTPQNCHYTLVADPAVLQQQLDKKERWLGAAYACNTVPKKQLKEWALSTGHSAICIPSPNHYIPENFELCAEERTTAAIVASNQLGVCYLQNDQEFGVPKVAWTLTLKTPVIQGRNPKSLVLADLYCHAIQERLNSVAYHASMGGLSYDLVTVPGGVKLTIDGFHDKAEAFMTEIVQALKSTAVTKEEFTLYKELAKRHYINHATKSPLVEAKELLWNVLYKDHASLAQKERALSNLAYEDMQKFLKKVWKQCYLEAMLYGNISESQAKKVWSDLSEAFKQATPYPVEKHVKVEVATFSQAQLLQQKSEHPANALILAIDCGPFSFKRQAALDIVCKGFEEPFFTELRTKQQTAYVVRNWAEELERHLYSFFAIQSSSHDPRELLARFELFLESSLRDLTESTLPQKRFEAIRAAVIEKLKHPADNPTDKGRLIYKLAFNYDGDFQWLSKRIEALESLSYEEFVEHAHAFLGTENRRRLAVSIYGELPDATGGVHYQSISSWEKLRRLIDYQGKSTYEAL